MFEQTGKRLFLFESLCVVCVCMYVCVCVCLCVYVVSVVCRVFALSVM